MIQSINNKTKVTRIDKNIEKLCFTRPISLKKYTAIIRKCDGIQEIIMSQNTLERLSPKIKKSLYKKGIFVKVKQTKGRPLSVNLKQLYEAIDLFKDNYSFREISAKTGIPKSTAHFILRKAKKNKIKTKNKMYHLE